MLPPELVVLRLTPRPWTIEDCLAVSHYQTWFSHQLMDQDQKYQKLIAKLGMQALGARARRASVVAADGSRDMQHHQGRPNSWVGRARRAHRRRAALHAADPHLSIDQVPGLWYLAGLHSEEGLNVVGVTYGGAPFVVMGHNADIAFSFTVASVDLIDYYDDAPAGAAIREEIRVKGEDQPRVIEVRRGARGVMIDDKTSLHWAGFDFAAAEISDAALRLQKAKTFDEFRRVGDALRRARRELDLLRPRRQHRLSARRAGSGARLRHLRAAEGERSARGVARLPRARRDAARAQSGAGVSGQLQQPAGGAGRLAVSDPRLLRSVPHHARDRACWQTKRTPDDMRAMQLDLTSGLSTRWKALAAEGAKAAGLEEEARMLDAVGRHDDVRQQSRRAVRRRGGAVCRARSSRTSWRRIGTSGACCSTKR